MTELFVSYPDFKWLELNIYTKDSPQSVTSFLSAEVPTSLGEIGIEKIILDFGLPDDVRGASAGDAEYGPMMTILINNDGAHKRLDLSLSRSPQDAHVRVKFFGDQVNVLFDSDLPIFEIDSETVPHEIP